MKIFDNFESTEDLDGIGSESVSTEEDVDNYGKRANRKVLGDVVHQSRFSFVSSIGDSRENHVPYDDS